MADSTTLANVLSSMKSCAGSGNSITLSADEARVVLDEMTEMDDRTERRASLKLIHDLKQVMHDDEYASDTPKVLECFHLVRCYEDSLDS